MQLCRSSLRGVLIRGLLLCPVHRDFACVRSDLRGAAQTGQTHRSTAQTRPAHTGSSWARRGTSTQEGTFTDLSSESNWLWSVMKVIYPTGRYMIIIFSLFSSQYFHLNGCWHSGFYKCTSIYKIMTSEITIIPCYHFLKLTALSLTLSNHLYIMIWLYMIYIR